MNQERLFNAMRFGNDLKFDFDLLTFNKLMKIRGMCHKHHKLCEDYCNIPDFNPEKIDKQEEKINKFMKELPAGLKLEIENIQRDPRGWTIRFNNYWFNYIIWVK